jgi:hypothetical protein
MSFYFTDQVEITPISGTDPYNKPVTGTAFTNEARVENTDKIVYGSNGQRLSSDQLIMLPSNVDISPGDRIQVKKMRGSVVTEDVREVISAFKVGDFGISHWEVYV